MLNLLRNLAKYSICMSDVITLLQSYERRHARIGYSFRKSQYVISYRPKLELLDIHSQTQNYT